ncbi:MAG: N-acetylmuramoyl-L-alanine amidase [Planctomycetes bacterium]|nr:N-acetylmuramoyl-L-alanine amidase [Planctomycetota bacterium]
MSRRSLSAVAALALFALAGCRTAPPSKPLPPPIVKPLAPAHGRSIVLCGERFDIEAPVVLWTDKGGYDAYSTELRFPDSPPKEPIVGVRYQAGRKLPLAEGEKTPRVTALPGDPRRRADVRALVDQFVVHYDVCGTSAQCFKVLHDRRKLSVHFMLDIDGLLYQTMDVSDTAWHASQANGRSIGIEIANIGAYKPDAASTLDEWYPSDEHGPRIQLPAWMKDGGVRTPGFVGRPARPERIVGAIHGVDYAMYDLTPQQYDTLGKLVARLCAELPRIRPDAPRDALGKVRMDALSPEEFAAFSGIVGHHHITVNKQDPGPAFDWERFLGDVRARLAPRGRN